MCSYMPLTTEQPLPAISQDEYKDTIQPVGIDLDEDTVLEYCHNLLVVDPTRKVVCNFSEQFTPLFRQILGAWGFNISGVLRH
jgi:hypothetical protein